MPTIRVCVNALHEHKCNSCSSVMCGGMWLQTGIHVSSPERRSGIRLGLVEKPVHPNMTQCSNNLTKLKAQKGQGGQRKQGKKG